jgi:DNA-binding NtrC family response regulator
MSPEAGSQIALLFITTSHEDYAELAGIIAKSSMCLKSQWKPETCGSVGVALGLLRNQRIPIILCEHTGDDSWKDLLEQTGEVPGGPYVIVTSRIADEQLWSQALNLGAYDVLSTPFNPEEVARVLSSAWDRWTGVAERSEAVAEAALTVSGAR